MPDSEAITVGSSENYWIWTTNGVWDLTRSTNTHLAGEIVTQMHRPLLLECEISNILIDPVKTALLIIDMQNYSMAKELQSNIAVPEMFEAENSILKHAIPAARKAGMQIIWLQWGLTEEDLTSMPPSALRVFDWKANSAMADYGLSTRSDSTGFTQCRESRRVTRVGQDLGEIMCDDGTRIAAGRALMRDTWNTAPHGPLLTAFHDGQSAPRRDILVYKNRNSGLYDPNSPCHQALTEEKIQTLLFTGMNTDQCVMGTLQDAHAAGYDTVLLRDGCATDSPRYSQLSAEYNCCRNWGFVSTCEALANAVASDSEQ